ncbi:hypothetical protein BDV96DRAFT_644008 [Lophiotrema nucula]|uniref:Uncharacterized protein n=1 Tax=Lophiotrema nucula TaxID=690887 RepID=A0A6A5ZG01_9PLEO|nr:hypothetical protein BDV96DRAFT_644008 [Lophiotrema nucula]
MPFPNLPYTPPKTPTSKMMLATYPQYQQPSFTPSRPSPLSPLSDRHVNALPQFSFRMGAQSQEEKKPVPQRAFKPNPVMQNRDQVTRRRRDMFFKRVQQDRDDKKWEARGDQIQRLDFVSEQKKWEAAKARQAQQMGDEYVDEELYNEMTSSQQHIDASESQQGLSEADYVLQQEERDLQDLIALIEQEDSQRETASQHYGSDDDDYDSIFMECTSTSGGQQVDECAMADIEDVDVMDTT